MGTSMGLFGIINSSFSADELRRKLENVPTEDDAVIAWKANAKWLPYFDDSLCEGFQANPEGAKQLSIKLCVPVLIFSLFDSDALFLYYSDAKTGINQQYARANRGLFCEVLGLSPEEMVGGPNESVPEFLFSLCDEKELRKIWERENYVFADDRLVDLCHLLKSEVIEDVDNLPEGFEEIRLK